MKRTNISQFFTHRQVYIKKAATPPPTFSRGYARTENSKANLCQHLLHSDQNINMWLLHNQEDETSKQFGGLPVGLIPEKGGNAERLHP